MLRRELKNHVSVCYIFMTNIESCNAESKKNIVYPDITSAIRQVPRDVTISVLTR